MGNTLGIICTINELGNRLESKFREKTSFLGITLANPADANFVWDHTHYLVHLSEVKSKQMRQLYVKNPGAKVIAFSGKLRNRNFYAARYPNVTVYDTAVGAWEACEAEAPKNNSY